MHSYLSHFFGIGIPAALVFSCFGAYRRQALEARKLHSSLPREAALHIFVLCLFGLAAMVLWPGYHFEPSDGLWGDLVIHNGRESWAYNMNLVPFRMVADYLRAFREGELFYAIVMLFGNLGTFLPLGFLILTVTKKEKLMAFTFIMQNIAANLGGMLTPFGNPQNLYLYSKLK